MCFFCGGKGAGGVGTVSAHVSPLGIRLAFSLRPKLFKVAVPIILRLPPISPSISRLKLKKKKNLIFWKHFNAEHK